MNIQALKFFVDAADLRSFTDAAGANYVTQPAFSRKVAELEAYCGFSLFDRSQRPIALSPEGREVYAAAVELLRKDEELEELVRGVREGRAATLNVAYVMGGHQRLVTPALRDLQAKFPAATLAAERLFAPQAFQALADGTADVVVCNAPEHRGHPETESELIAKSGLVALIPKDHRLAGRSSICLMDLAGESMVTMARFGSPAVFDAIQAECRRRGFEPRFSHYAPDTVTFSMMLSLHREVALMPCTTLLFDGESVDVVPLKDTAGFDTVAVWREGDGNRLVREFVGLMGVCGKALSSWPA